MANLATINNNLLADSGIDPISVVTGAGTATQIAYWSSGSAITGENGLVWDATNNRMGNGVVTPAASLHIEGSGSTYSVPSDSNVPGIYVQNTNSASTSANAFISLRTTGANGGNPIVSWDIGGIIGWSAGIDNADSDSFKIANYWGNVNLNTRLRISLAGGLRLNAYGSGSFTGTVAYNLAVDSSGNIIEVTDGGGTVTGSGTVNYIPKWTSASAIGNSAITDDGTTVSLISRALSGTSATFSGNINTTNGSVTIKTTSFGGLLNLQSGTTTDNWQFYHYSLDNSLRFNYNGAGSDEFILTTAGNVTYLGTVTGSSIIKTGGTSSQYLMADGSVSTLTNPVTGTGTAGYLPKFTGASTVGNSPMYDASGSIGLNTTTPALNGFNREFTVSAGTSGTARAAINIQGSRTASSTFGVLGFFHQTNYVAGIESSRGGDDTSGILQFFTSNTTGATEKMRLDASGNLGLAVTPSAWNSAYKAIQFGTTGALFGESGDAAIFLSSNGFVDAGGGFKYITTDFATAYTQENGVHTWKIAPSGTAGNAISFTQAMTLKATSQLQLNQYGSGSFTGTRAYDLAIDTSGNIIEVAVGAGTVTGTGTTNYVTKWTSASAVGNSVLYDNGTSVSIGTVTPVTLLHIQGSGSTYSTPESNNVPGIYVYNSNSTDSTANAFIALRTLSANGGDPFISWDIDGIIGWSAGIDNSDSDKFKIANSWSALDSATRFTIDGFGNIGVGTSTPNGSSTERTIVLANNTATYYLTNGANTLRGIFALGNATSEVFIGTQTDHNFHLRTNDTARLWITNKGNLGLGTTFVLGSYLSSASQSGVFQTATSVAKAATASDNILAFFGSNDATNPLGLFIGMQTGATAGARMVRLQVTEIGASANHILIQPDGGYVGIGNYFTSANFYQPTTLLHISNGNSSYTAPSANNLPSIYLHNTNNASTTAHAILTLRTKEAGGGNPFISFDVENVTGWAMGIDNADSDSFKLNWGWSSLTSATALKFSTTTLAATFYGPISGTSASFSSTVTATIFDSTSNAYRFNGNNALSLVSLNSQNVVKINAAGYWGVQLVGANDQGILINNVGNVGVRGTPDSWASGWASFQLGANAAIAYTGAGANDFSFSTNSFFDSADDRWEYRYTGDGAARYSMTALTREHRWFIAPVGTAGAAISWTQAMTLDASGNLGLGATPVVRLTVSGGSMNIASASTGNSNTLYFGDEVQRSSGKCIFMESYYLKIQGHRNEGVILQGTDGNSNLQTFASFYGSANGSYPSTALLYPAGGRVAIGTTSPLGDGSSERTLHLAAAASANATFYITNSANTLKGIFAIGSAASSIAIGSQSNHNFKIVTNDTDRIYVTSDGRLGIGTTFTIGGYLDSASQTGVVQQATNIAKASTARDVPLYFFGSNDASYPLGLYVGMRTGATTARRQLKLQGTEIGLSPNNILLQPDGANIGLGSYFGTIATDPAVLLHISNNGSSYSSPESNNFPCIYLNNTNSSSSTAHALLVLRTYGASGGNPFISFDINGVQGWAMGIDNADGDKFKLNYGWSSLTSATRLTFETNGNATFVGSVTASSFFEPSDIRLKDIIERNPLVSLDIDLVKYKKKDKDGIRYGYIAQEVKALIPELAEGDDILSLNYQDIHSIKIAALEAKIKELESQLKNK